MSMSRPTATRQSIGSAETELMKPTSLSRLVKSSKRPHPDTRNSTALTSAGHGDSRMRVELMADSSNASYGAKYPLKASRHGKEATCTVGRLADSLGGKRDLARKAIFNEFLEANKTNSDYQPIPDELAADLLELCEANSIDNATFIQLPSDWKTILIIGVDVATIQTQLNKVMARFPNYKVITQKTDNQVHTTQYTDTMIVQELICNQQSLWMPSQEATLELIVKAKAKNKDDSTNCELFFAVVPAHLLFNAEERSDFAKADQQEEIRLHVEKNTTQRRYIMRIKIADIQEDKFDLRHPPLIAYRYLVALGAYSQYQEKLHPFLILNDMALLQLDTSSARLCSALKKILHRYQSSPLGDAIFQIHYLEELQLLGQKQMPIAVGRRQGNLLAYPAQLQPRGQGQHLIFTLKESESALMAGDCGHIVYLVQKDGKQHPLGLFIGKLKAEIEPPIYQAVILYLALKELEELYPHHVQDIRLLN